jgi:hypothetical protein
MPRAAGIPAGHTGDAVQKNRRQTWRTGSIAVMRPVHKDESGSPQEARSAGKNCTCGMRRVRPEQLPGGVIPCGLC